MDLNPALVWARGEGLTQNWRQPPNTHQIFIGALQRTGLPEAAAAPRKLFAAG